jgi:CheY-like chemotaxis protein
MEALMPRILLVERHVHAGSTLASILRGLGYTVDCAYSAASAIDHLQVVGADLVIVGVQELPCMDGWQFLNWLGRRQVPVIVHDRFNGPEWDLAKRAGATELWVRGALSVDSICESLEGYFDTPRSLAA